jgi:hypothetical protein
MPKLPIAQLLLATLAHMPQLMVLGKDTTNLDFLFIPALVNTLL